MDSAMEYVMTPSFHVLSSTCCLQIILPSSVTQYVTVFILTGTDIVLYCYFYITHQ
jgi:hypothetical protein